jgi:hypothetical protein
MKPRLSPVCAAQLCLVFLLAATSSPAAPVRVTAWNLRTPSAAASPDTSENRIREAAAGIHAQDPDIVILEQVADWQTCSLLAQALKPANYSVILCSAFRDPRTGASARQQLAILSKRKAYFSWSEAWQADSGGPSPGGYAFAAIRTGGQKLGIFAVQLDDSLVQHAAGPNPALARSRAAAIQQWLQTVDSFKEWVTNRVEAAVVAGSFNNSDPAAPAGAEDLRFVQVLLAAPLEQPILLAANSTDASSDHVLARLSANADNLPGVILDRFPSTCDLDLTRAAPVLARADTPAPEPNVQPQAPAPAQPTPAAAAAVVPPVQVAQATPAKSPTPWLTGALGAVALFVVFAWWLARRRTARLRTSTTLMTVSAAGRGGVSTSDALVITPRSITGSAQDSSAHAVRPIIHIESPDDRTSDTSEWKRRAIAAEQRADRASAVLKAGLLPQLSQWLKHKLVRRLVSDRAELLETQHAATLKALAVDERLSRIEQQIQRQTLAYERRIDELTRELAVAREENRDLIRAKIAQVKAEMEAARARLLAQSRQQDP